MSNESCGFTEELSEMGFKGALLRRLLDCIVDADTMQEFDNFIMLNELNEGPKMTKVLLVHRFVSHMQDKHSFSDSDDFITQFEAAETQEEKETLISKLLALKASPLMLKKVAEQLTDNPSKLPLLYDKVVKYRKVYKPDEIATLLDTMPI